MAIRGSVVRRQLGRRLRSLREEAGKTIKDVEEAKIFSSSKVFRIESGRAPLRPGDVWTLCQFYDVAPGLTDALATLSDGAQHDAWWENHHKVSPRWFHLYRALETTCNGLFTYHPELVHGLLQVDEYTERVIASDGALDREVIRQRLDVRLERKLTTFGRDGIRITAVLGASALVPGIRSPEIMERQYRHLCDLGAGEHTSIRVLPEAIVGRVKFPEPFTLLEFDNPRDPAVVYVETQLGGQYFERDEHVAEYRKTAAILMDLSIPVKEFDYDHLVDQGVGVHQRQ
jgi:transcriptional regulator with XRE-family HTH domain